MLKYGLALLCLGLSMASYGSGWSKDRSTSTGFSKMRSCNDYRNQIQKRLSAIPEKLKKPSGVNLSKLGLGAGKVLRRAGDPRNLRTPFKYVPGFGSGRRSLGLSDSGSRNNFGSGSGGLGGGGLAGSRIGESRSGRARARIEIPSSQAVSGGGLTSKEILTTIGGYTKTNNQFVNVDEPDIFKTNGNYIYHAVGSKLHILRAWPTRDLKKLITIPFESPIDFLFIEGQQLILGYAKYVPHFQHIKLNYKEHIYNFSRSTERTEVAVFDLENQNKPKLLYKRLLMGRYHTSRLVNQKIVLVTSMMHQISYDYHDARDEVRRQGLDHVVDTENLLKKIPLSYWHPDLKELQKSNCQSVYLKDDDVLRDHLQYVSVLDLKTQKTKKTLLHTKAQLITMDERNLAITNSNSSDSEVILVNFGRNDQAYISAVGKVPGQVLNTFSVDWKDNFLRVATTEFRDNDINRIYVLQKIKKRLRVVGRTKPMAKNEDIKSVRFLGDRAYVVTFRKVDPLFVVDLKNAMRPRVLGELKVPGFSTYIHFLDSKTLLTMGNNANARTGRTTGLRLSLFDVSNEKKPRLLDAINSMEGYKSAANQTHLAFNYDPVSRILTIPVQTNRYYIDSRIDVFHIKKNHKIENLGEMISKGVGEFERSMIVNSYLYGVATNGIQTAPLRSPSRTLSKIVYKKTKVSAVNESVGGAIRTNLNQVRHCYEKLLQRTPDASGKVKVKFVIGSMGRVSKAEVVQSNMNSTLGRCITSRIKRWKFPKPRGEKPVTVTYPFNFNPG